VARGLDAVNGAVTDFSDEFIVIPESESEIRILRWWRGD
jgi:hypothetical protein